MSGGKVFLDTNVFVYMYDASEPKKKEISLSLLDANECVTSTQAINELNNVLTRKLKTPISNVKQIIHDIHQVTSVRQISTDTILSALDIMEQYKYSYYDSLMIASALENGCVILFSEDMQGGQLINSTLKMTNPYER